MKHDGMLNTKELKEWANAKAIKSALSRIVGSAKIDGNANVKVGSTVVLKGFGQRFNGYGYVSGVRHDVQGGNWFTYVQFGLAEEWFNRNGKNIQEQSANGLLPGVQGLHRGIVTNLYNDKPKETEERIQIKIPRIDNNSEGIWARIAQPDAGNNRGILFRPEIGDEVVVAFLNNDPRFPIVLGMLHSSTNKAPIVADNKNPEKGIFTKSEMKILFNDEKKNIIIATKANNEILVSEEKNGIFLSDQNGNSIQMNPDGIILESAKDIVLKAKKDVKIEGLSIKNNASTKFQADGKTGAELTTNSIAVLKGSVVKIN